VAAKQQHVEGLFIGDASAVITRVSGDCAQQGYNPTYVTEGAGFGMVMASAPGTRDNTWSEYSDLPFFANNPQMQAMKTAMDKYFPGVVENANLFLQDAAMAWTSGVLLEHAIKASGLTANATPSSTEVLQGLNSLKNDNLEGLAPPLTFTAGQVHKVDCWFTGRIQNGTPTVANNGQVTCAHGTSGSSS
jgi:branched-chain amino acid transport system substrate-binding protein